MIIKTPLTKEQKDFIKKYKISEDLLIDAAGAGMSDELKQDMLDNKQILAYNTESCAENSDHNFLTIEGLCPQCDPSKIATALIEYSTGYIFVCGSKKGSIVKVGSAVENKDRLKTINSFSAKSEGFEDWELLFYATTVTLGRAERMIQHKLNDYKTLLPKEKATKLKPASEMYRCSYNKAKEAIEALQEEAQFEFTYENEKKHIISEYQFKNLISKGESRAVIV